MIIIGRMCLFIYRDYIGVLVKQKICSYHQDDEFDWVAELECGHYQHVRHDPPWMNRPWVLTEQGRQSKLGFELECKKCDEAVPKDIVNN